MPYVVADLKDFDEYGDTITLNDHLKKWFIKQLKKEVVTRLDWLKKLDVQTSNDEHVLRAMRNREDIYITTAPESYREEYLLVMDWLPELEIRDPRLFAKLDRITWKQAVEHSRRWHEALARQTEKTRNETIPFDENCPVMFTHDDGYKWVWLKTDRARDDEGRLMGHCVGNGNYDIMSHKSGTFSLRDSFGNPHVTAELSEDRIVQVMMKGNVRVELGSKYSKHALEFQRFMEPLLTLKPKQEGVDHLVWWNGDETWYLDGKLHRKDNPAVLKIDGSEEWYEHGYLHRKNGPAITWSSGDREWWIRGKRHRDDDPAVIGVNGDEIWFRNNKHHRIDGPAIIDANGDRLWYKNGLCHREDDEPAIIRANGDIEYYNLGNRHRENGPAVIKTNGVREWWVNGVQHREDGPAIERMNGNYEWYFHGQIHRKDGPAIQRMNGNLEWFYNGKPHREDGPAVICTDGTKEWWKNGYLHREDGPAVIRYNGDQEWWKNGYLHREDGPAIIKFNGDQEWWLKGRRHRTNGPAIISADKRHQSWWMNGNFTREIYKHEYVDEIMREKYWYNQDHQKHREDGPAIIRLSIFEDGRKSWSKEWRLNNTLHREDGPAIIRSDGYESWHDNGKIHRKDGPAVTWPDGSKEWWKNGEKHREDGPAVENSNGDEEWWSNGQKINSPHQNP